MAKNIISKPWLPFRGAAGVLSKIALESRNFANIGLQTIASPRGAIIW